MRNFTIVALLLLITTFKISAQNLLNMEDWKIGEGSAGTFGLNGQISENTREWGEGPNGKRVIIWKAKPEGLANDDGGWNGNPFLIDHTKMYRFTVWLKKSNSKDGISYFGCQGTYNLDGSRADNPYFWNGKLPELDKWYLLVGYIHGSGDNSLIHYGGVYDGVTAIKVLDCIDYKSALSSETSLHRSYLFYDPNVNDSQYFYGPRVEVVNGNEPSVETLLGTSSIKSSYFQNKVGILTQNPGNYELAVNGRVRAKEIKVEAGWSDFVFEKDYPLLPLLEVAAFVERNKHLPDVPSEKEVSLNGIELGKINSKLLQKIEELTLYLIQQQKEIQTLKEKVITLEKH